MKKIGILTVHHFHNYGSVLQALATQHYIEKQGYNAEIIDYRPLETFYNSYKYYNFDRPIESISFKKKMMFILKKTGINLKKDEYTNFRNILRLTPKIYTLNDLYTKPPEYDVYIAGSDQIWNPYITYNNPAYFLKFVKSGKKISYATSIGVPRIPENLQQDFNRGINNFHCISVREKESVEIVSQLTGIHAEWVLDPTLLLVKEDWKQFADVSNVSTDYILCYFLEPNSFCETLYKKVQKDLKLPLVYIGVGNSNKDIEYTGKISPSRFLRLFMDAKAVVTNSFHGMAFATNFNKILITTYRNTDSEKSMNSRHTSFLELFSLKDQLFLDCGDLHNSDSYYINWDTINKILQEQREKSKKYLLDAIGE
jgi:hypothetical protein